MINFKVTEIFFSLQKVDYITYLSIFDQLFDIPKERKNAAYRE